LTRANQAAAGVVDMRWVPHRSGEALVSEELAEVVPVSDDIRLRFGAHVQARGPITLEQGRAPDTAAAPAGVEYRPADGV
jgi:hypothetical protein